MPISNINNKNSHFLRWMSCFTGIYKSWIWKQFHKFLIGLILRFKNRQEGTWTQLGITLFSILTCPKPRYVIFTIVFTEDGFQFSQIIIKSTPKKLCWILLSSVGRVECVLRITRLLKLADAMRRQSPTLWDKLSFLPPSLAHVWKCEGRKSCTGEPNTSTPVHPKSGAPTPEAAAARGDGASFPFLFLLSGCHV